MVPIDTDRWANNIFQQTNGQSILLCGEVGRSSIHACTVAYPTWLPITRQIRNIIYRADAQSVRIANYMRFLTIYVSFKT